MIKQKMYKITLWDSCCPSCTSGTVSWFTKDINQFKLDWEQFEKDDTAKERFNKSLNGEIITDYYSDDINKFTDTIESICYIQTKRFNSIGALRYDAKKTELDKRSLLVLLHDILGEAG